MKKLVILFFSLLVFSGANAQNWTSLNSGTSLNLSSVYFPTPDVGYVVGEGGLILKTTDGGASWTNISIIYPLWIYTVYFISADTGWIGCETGKTMYTTNGGSTWDYGVLAPYFYKVTSMCFTSADTGYLVGANLPSGGNVFGKSTDGGFSWTYYLASMGSNWLESICFPGPNTGCTVGDSGTILKTIDAGSNWAFQLSGTTSDLYSVYFTNLNNGHAVGDNGTILVTTDGGTNWTNQVSGTSTGLKSVFFTDANTGYTAGDNGVILNTSNGGTDWVYQPSGTSQGLHSVFFPNADTGYAVGDSGTILKTTNGGGVGFNEHSFSSNLFKVHPNPATSNITVEASVFTGNTSLSILNVNGQVLRKRQITGSKTQIDISDLPPGVYFIVFQNNKAIEVEKLIIE